MLIGGLSACQDNDTDTAPQEPEDTRYIYLHFKLEYMTSADQTVLNSTHAYITEGYTVTFSGGVLEEYETIYDVDLTESIKFEANEDVVVRVTHPDYNEEDVTDSAYYGLEPYSLRIDSVDSFTLMLNPLQGYVIVNTDETFDLEKYSLTVNDEGSLFNKIYYVSKEIVVSEISYSSLAVAMGDANIIGDGLVYYAYEDEHGNLNFM